jgi:hypothetical protein
MLGLENFIEVSGEKIITDLVSSGNKQNYANTNWSSIKDKMIRLSASLTEDYAGDIIYLIDEIQWFLNNPKELYMMPKTWLFGFRELGVHFTNEVLRTEPINQYGVGVKAEYRDVWRLDIVVEDDKKYRYPYLKFYKVRYFE